jgi:hypothetical protein
VRVIANTDPLRRLFLETLGAVISFYTQADGSIALSRSIERVFSDWEDQDPQEFAMFIRHAAFAGAKKFYQAQQQSRRWAAKKRNEPDEGDEPAAHSGNGGPTQPQPGAGARDPQKDELDAVYYYPGHSDPLKMGDATPEMQFALADKLQRERDSKDGLAEKARRGATRARRHTTKLTTSCTTTTCAPGTPTSPSTLRCCAKRRVWCRCLEAPSATTG